MVFPLSDDMIRTVEQTKGVAPIELQIRGEQASALGLHGQRMTAALDRLRAAARDEAGRDDLVWRAAEAVWHYFIQREACGLRNHRQAIAFYGIPGEVLARLGARPPKTAG